MTKLDLEALEADLLVAAGKASTRAEIYRAEAAQRRVLRKIPALIARVRELEKLAGRPE
jgi:hypothetical protein